MDTLLRHSQRCTFFVDNHLNAEMINPPSPKERKRASGRKIHAVEGEPNTVLPAYTSSIGPSQFRCSFVLYVSLNCSDRITTSNVSLYPMFL